MRTIAHYTILALVLLVLFASNIIFGAIDIPISDIISIVCGGEAEKASWKFIILESRTPQALTALLSGAALATSGLMLQTAFRNPLADPSIFGISSGAGLGVALVVAGLLDNGAAAVLTKAINICTDGHNNVFNGEFTGSVIVKTTVCLLCIDLEVLDRYVCTVCGYEHEGPLPDDFICPWCKHPASDFERVS